MIKDNTLVLEGVQVSLNSLISVVMGNRNLLDFLLTKQVEVCMINDSSCFSLIDREVGRTTEKVEEVTCFVKTDLMICEMGSVV